MSAADLLPPNASTLERAMVASFDAVLDDVPVQIDTLWNPATCDVALLPWLAWGLSIDLWDADWSEATKRAAIADAIQFQRRKGTPASLRTVLDRIDPMIAVVEWFEDRINLDPYTFRLELPMAADSDVLYDEALVARILRDIATVKPARAHMFAVHRLAAQANAWLIGAASLAGYERMETAADIVTALDPAWDSYLQTEDGEPILGEDSGFLEVG
jgi:phage tail P2-like protein